MSLAASAGVLYRGESLSSQRSDRDRVDLIKQFHRSGLWTKLANGGNPYALAQLGLVDAVKRHIAELPPFEKTHFLSFTLDESAALRYATMPAPDDEDVDKAPYPDKEWRYTKYVVFKLRVAAMERLNDGIYRLDYNTGANSAVIIDAADYLAHLPDDMKQSAAFQTALNYATGDQEWLVLPVDRIEDGTLSACLCGGSDLDADHYVESGFFTDGPSVFQG